MIIHRRLAVVGVFLAAAACSQHKDANATIDFCPCDSVACQPQADRPGGVCDAQGHTCSAPDSKGKSTCTSAALPVGAISLVAAQYDVLGVSGSGYQEQSLLTFAVTTQDGRPYPAGLPVTFSHLSQGDSFVGPSPQCETSGATKTCESIATTDGAGRVAVLLSSGQKFALLFVRAEASAGGVAGSFTAGAFPVVAAKANSTNLTVECGSYSEIALTSAAPTPLGPPVTCTAQAMDRNGIAIGIPLEVSFHAEAGALGPLAWTPPYEPDKPIAEQQELGHAVTFLDLLATPPGDGVATVVAMLRGEEGFVDKNLNGRYDEGDELLDDEGEPYVDANDNGRHDEGEWYLDVNGNGTYDEPNGRWDADTVIWAQTHVAYPGAAVTALCNCADATCRPQGDRLGGVCDNRGNTCSALDTNGKSTCNSAPLAVGSIQLVAFDHDVLGAVGSGYHERSVLTFQVRTHEGQPYPPGLLVTFTHESQGDSFVGPLPNCAVTAGGPTCTAQGVTDTEGKVRVLLSSGRTFAVLSVRADAAAGGVNRSYTAGGFPVVGAKPNGAHLSLDCRPYNIPALTVHDCLYSRYAGRAKTVDCTLKMADRHGIVLGVPTEATFRSEAGAASYPATSPAYDPATAISEQRDLGHALGYLEIYGSPLPVDVEAFQGEPRVSVNTLCGSRTANPRDGLVTVIAMVRGEEGFVDVNLNGKYDSGEPFIDQGEPYVDANDNGTRDPDEWYLDANGNGQYDGPNGEWDDDTVLWTQTRVLYTGYPVLPTPGPMQYFSRFYTSGSPPDPTPTPADFVVVARPASHQDYGVFFTDENLNPLTSFATYEARPAFGIVNALLLGPDHTADELGISFRLLYCDKAVAPSACFSGPADNACRAKPCFVVPDVGLCNGTTCAGFVSGNRGTLRISGLGDETKLGDDAVMVTTEIEGVKNMMWIQGRSVLAGP